MSESIVSAIKAEVDKAIDAVESALENLEQKIAKINAAPARLAASAGVSVLKGAVASFRVAFNIPDNDASPQA